MEALALRYVADIERELIMTQGISAQSSRTRRRRGITMPRHASFSPLPSTPLSPPAHSWSTDPPSLPPRDSALAPAIPLRRLLPKPRTASWNHQPHLPISPPALSPARSAPRAVSLSPRFFDAHVEYVGHDCVIHNGMQLVDIATEHPQQRAIPRLINFSL